MLSLWENVSISELEFFFIMYLQSYYKLKIKASLVCDTIYLIFLSKFQVTAFPSEAPESPVFSEVRVARSSVFCVMFCRLLFIPFLLFILYCLSFFDLPLWYLQTFL
jgi:hypothetical protein